jgi:hypothetical protein
MLRLTQRLRMHRGRVTRHSETAGPGQEPIAVDKSPPHQSEVVDPKDGVLGEWTLMVVNRDGTRRRNEDWAVAFSAVHRADVYMHRQSATSAG